MDQMNHSGISHVVTATGDSDWYKNFAAPLAEALEDVLPRHIGDIPTALRQRMTRGAVNHIAAYVAIGVTIFVSQKLGGKSLDDFYDQILKPRFRKCFEWLDGKLPGGNRKAEKVFTSNIWYKEHNVVVSVSVVGKDFAEIVEQLDLIGIVHSNALLWIDQHGVAGPVHHYKIEHGKVNAKPLLFERVDQATIP